MTLAYNDALIKKMVNSDTLTILYFALDYHPIRRHGHSTVIIGNKLFLWGGLDRPRSIHTSEEKRRFITHIDVLNLDTGMWNEVATIGNPHTGIVGYASTAIANDIVFFGGWCGHTDCYYNNITYLNSSTFVWTSKSHEQNLPMKKSGCGIMQFTSVEEDYLFVVGGYGPSPNTLQQNANYHVVPHRNDRVVTNEQHLFIINSGKVM